MEMHKCLPLIALVVFLTACLSPSGNQPAPQVTATFPGISTATDSLTSTPQPTSTPIPSPTLTFTPTAVKYSAEQLDNMTDEQKIAVAREMAGDEFGDQTIVGEHVDGAEVAFYSTYQTTDEYGKSVVRTYTVGGVDLETGEVIPGYTPKELVAMHAEGTIPEKFYFDGKLVSRVVDTESALARAQEATYRGVEYPAEITYWQNEAGEIVLVDWPYWPGGPRDLMSFSASPDGKLVHLLPAVFEYRLTLENLNADEVKSIFGDTLMLDQKNADLLEVVNDPEGVVIVVNGLDSTAKNYWEGDEEEPRNAALVPWEKQVNELTKGFTFDRRNPKVGVAHHITPSRFIESSRTSITNDGGKYVALRLAEALAVANQDTTSIFNYEENFWDPFLKVNDEFRKFGVGGEMFDSIE